MSFSAEMSVLALKKDCAIPHYSKCHGNKYVATITTVSAAEDESEISQGTVYVIGAPRHKAAQIFDALEAPPPGSQINFRWWDSSPPAYNSKSSLSERWMGYEYNKEFYEVSQNESLRGPSLIILYYSNGQDPASHLDSAFQGTFEPADFETNILPVAEYILDRKSCKNVWASVFSTFLWIRGYLRSYFAPLPWDQLGTVSLACLFQRGGENRELGHVNRHFRYYAKLRRARNKADKKG